MHCASSFPGYYFARDLIPGAVAIPLPRSNSEITWRTETGYDVPPQQPFTDHYVGYDKEVMRQTMLNHEFTFRSQVHELHRLYRRQKELMSEFKWRYIQMQTSQSNPITSTIQYEISQKSLNVPGRAVLKGTGSDLSLLCAEKFQEPLVSIHHQRIDANPFPKIYSPIVGEKILDLELPGDQYVDSEEKENTVEENVAKVTGDPPKKSLKFLIDLNEPVQLDESEIPLSFSREDFDTCCTETNDVNQNLSQKSNKESENSNGTGAYTIQARQEIDVCSKVSDLQNSQVELPNHNSEAGLDGATLISAKHVSSTGISPLSRAETTRSRSNISEEVHDLHVEVETKIFGSCISCAHQLVPQSVEPKIKSLSSVSSQRKSVRELTELPFAVQALPCFHTPKLFNKSSKSVLRSSNINSDRFNEIEDSINALEGPVSPENKECSPPRGESDDMQLDLPHKLAKEDEHPIREIERVAAETIISISSSGVQRHLKRPINTTQEPPSDCLEWFAGVVSSMAGKLENLFCESIDCKEEKTADSSLPKQRGRVRKAKQQRVAKKKALHNLGVVSRATEVKFNKVTKRKRIMGENDFTERTTHCCALEQFIHSPLIRRVEDKHIGKCLRGWGSLKGRRRVRRGRIGFHDFPPLAHDC